MNECASKDKDVWMSIRIKNAQMNTQMNVGNEWINECVNKVQMNEFMTVFINDLWLYTWMNVRV